MKESSARAHRVLWSIVPWLFVAVFALAPVAHAADAPDAGTPQGVLTKAPTIARQVQAVYPPEAAQARLSATVLLNVTIGADGSVTDVQVVQPAGQGFDEAAVAALRQFRFTPAEIDGKPAPVQIQYAYHFVAPEPPKGPPLNFEGEVIARDTGQPLPNASVIVEAPPHPLSAITDARGHFAIRGVPPGTFPVRVKAAGYERYHVDETFKPDVRTQVRYYVRKSQTSPLEVVVRGRRERREMTEVALQREEILRIPGSNGDAFRVLQNLPGVARSPFGLGRLVVRGGQSWDTRVYVDGIQVPQLFHFAGLYATFNSDLLESIDFQPGSFGVGFGRSVGGLVRALTRTPGQEGAHGHVDVNLVDASVLYERPLSKDWSFVVSGRRSYVDLWLPYVVPSDVLKLTIAPRYYDYQVRVERKVGTTRSWFELFGSNDRLGLALANPAVDPEGHATFDTYVLYNRLTFHDERPLAGWSSRLDAAVGYDRSVFNVGQDISFETDTYPLTLREQIFRRFGAFALTLGTDLYAFPYTLDAQLPQDAPRPGAIPNPLVSRSLTRVDTSSVPFEPALFGELRLHPIASLELALGLRADWESQMHKGWLDPRLAAFWTVSPQVKLKAAAGLYHQPPNYQRGLLSKDFGNPDLLPEAASQYSVGVEAALSKTLSLNVDLYDEELFHLATASRAPAPGAPPAPRYVSSGTGRSYGLELLLRHQFSDRFFGWISYSLSRAERTAPGQTGLQQSRYDQPQHLVLLASWRLSGGWTVGGRIQYTSGPLDTPFVGAIYDANAARYQPIPGDPYSVRLPAFFQADLRVDKRWQYRDWALTLYADIQNVTNRQNVEDASYNFDYTQRDYVHGLPILPVLGLRADF